MSTQKNKSEIRLLVSGNRSNTYQAILIAPESFWLWVDKEHAIEIFGEPVRPEIGKRDGYGNRVVTFSSRRLDYFIEKVEEARSIINYLLLTKENSIKSAYTWTIPSTHELEVE